MTISTGEMVDAFHIGMDLAENANYVRLDALDAGVALTMETAAGREIAGLEASAREISASLLARFGQAPVRMSLTDAGRDKENRPVTLNAAPFESTDFAGIVSGVDVFSGRLSMLGLVGRRQRTFIGTYQTQVLDAPNRRTQLVRINPPEERHSLLTHSMRLLSPFRGRPDLAWTTLTSE